MDCYPEALQRIRDVFARAQRLPLSEPLAATLATTGPDGRPAVRVVLVRGFDERGFVFYTNLESRKAQHLTANPRAALGFFWDALMEQILVEGQVSLVSADEADTYWATRPRASQIAAWASLQSQPLDRRETLIARVATYQLKFVGRAVPRPPRWSGYRLTPDRIELWKQQPSRLHERTLYQQQGSQWTRTRLYP